MAQNDETPVGSYAPLSLPVPDSGNLAELNPYGYKTDPEITRTIDEARAAKKKLADSLEQRYAKTNWGNIMAAFGKPQLGGFAASMGTVGDVLGRQIENQKAIAPTVYAMRAQLAAQEAALAHRSRAAEIEEKAANDGREMTLAERAAYAAHRGENVGAIGQDVATNAFMRLKDSILGGMDVAQAMFEVKKAFGEAAANKAFQDYKNLIPTGIPDPSKPPVPPATDAVKPPASSEKDVAKPPPRTTPPGVPEYLKQQLTDGAITDNQYQQFVKEYSDTYNKDRNALGSIKNNSQSVFNTAVKAYGIASKPSLRQYLGIGRSGKISDLAIQIMQGSALGKIFGDSPSAVKKQWNMSDEDFTDLNNLAREMANLKALSATNPAGTADPDQKFANQTDFRTELETMANPSMGDSHMSLLKGLAMMASKAKIGIEAPAVLSSFVQNRNNDINDFKSSAELYDLGEQHKARSTDILDKYPAIDPKTGRYQKPSWFESKSSGTSSGSSRPQEQQTASGRLVKVDGKWVRRP